MKIVFSASKVSTSKISVNKTALFFLAFLVVTLAVYCGRISIQAAQSDIASVLVTQATEFSFSPTATGYWTFETSNNFDGSDPYLSIFNEYGHLLASDDDSAGYLNSHITMHMVEGAEYIVEAGFWAGGTGSYMLDISFSEVFMPPPDHSGLFAMEYHRIPSAGGQVEAFGEAFFLFVPDSTGLWHFQIYSDAEPFYMQIMDPLNATFAMSNGWLWDLDDVGHASFTVHLVAGVEYTVETGFIWMQDRYILSVSPTDEFVPWLPQEYLYEEGFPLDLESERAMLPPAGGEVFVEGQTFFSFIPNATGPWAFTTSNNIGDPLLLLTDTYGSIIFLDDDGAGDLNSFLVVYLAQGVEYILWARFWQLHGTGSYTLTIEPFEPFIETAETVRVPAEFRRLPGSGGHFTITRQEAIDQDPILFTPSEQGTWVLHPDGPGTLIITDYNNTFLAANNARHGGNFITVDLAAGTEYRIFFTGVIRDYINLTIAPYNRIILSEDAEYAQRLVIRQTDFFFLPNQGGYWTFVTFGPGRGDPYLWIYDNTGTLLASDDDGGGWVNAMIKIYLEPHTEYIIRAGFFQDTNGEYTLDIQRSGYISTPRPRLMPPELH